MHFTGEKRAYVSFLNEMESKLFCFRVPRKCKVRAVEKDFQTGEWTEVGVAFLFW